MCIVIVDIPVESARSVFCAEIRLIPGLWSELLFGAMKIDTYALLSRQIPGNKNSCLVKPTNWG